MFFPDFNCVYDGDIIIYLLYSFLTLIRSMGKDIIIYLLCYFVALVGSIDP
jgi:hypothetical protein